MSITGRELWYAIESQHGREYTDQPEVRDDPAVLIAFEPDDAKDAVLVKREDIGVILACLAEDLKHGGWLGETDHDGARRRVLGVRDRLRAALDSDTDPSEWSA